MRFKKTKSQYIIIALSPGCNTRLFFMFTYTLFLCYFELDWFSITATIIRKGFFLFIHFLLHTLHTIYWIFFVIWLSQCFLRILSLYKKPHKGHPVTRTDNNSCIDCMGSNEMVKWSIKGTNTVVCVQLCDVVSWHGYRITVSNLYSLCWFRGEYLSIFFFTLS